MRKYLFSGLGGGILFALLDGVLNANPLAVRLMAPYQPIARKSPEIAPALLIDLAFGFILAVFFLRLYSALPGANGPMKGLAFGVLVWILRVVMRVASDGVMFDVPASTLFYLLVAGLLETLALGGFFGWALGPPKPQ